jgi:hypothetical protein
MIATPTGYQDPMLGVAFIVGIALAVIFATLFPERKE